MLREILWEDWITNPSQGYEIKTNTLYKQNITLPAQTLTQFYDSQPE